jgi:glycogen operon protein
VNYVTAHDGLTLRDLVSYDTKHNEANGEHNRDGTSDDRSWNCGVEGETDDAAVVALRHRQAANLLVTLCLTAGVPMICAGDERGRTQRGNNNAYVQDNEVSWVDWNESSWQDLHELTRAALRLRRDHPVLRQPLFLQGRPVVDGGNKDLAWVHPTGREMTDGDWFDGQQRTLGMFLSGSPLRAPGPRGERLHDASFLLWFNARAESVAATLPERDCLRHAEVVLRTDPGHAAGDRFGAGESIELAARSVVVLRQV